MEEIKVNLHLLNENVKRFNRRLDIMDRKMEEEFDAMGRYISKTDKKIASKFRTMDRKFADIDRRFAVIKLSSHISKNILEGSMYEVGRYFREMDQRVQSIEHLANDQYIPPSRGERPFKDNPCYAQESGDVTELHEIGNEAAQRG